MDKQKIKAIASELINESIVCNRKAAILKKLLQSNEIVEAFNQRHAGATLGLLRSVHYRDLALQCFNALVDSDHRTISFFQVKHLFSSLALLDDLREDFAMPRLPPYSAGMALSAHEHELVQSQRRQEDLTRFDKQIDEIKKIWKRFEKDSPDYKRLRDLRDTVLAHNELNESNLAPASQQAVNLKYGELWGFVQALQEAATLLQSVCNSAGFDFSSAEKNNLGEVERFVSVFLK